MVATYGIHIWYPHMVSTYHIPYWMGSQLELLRVSGPSSDAKPEQPAWLMDHFIGRVASIVSSIHLGDRLNKRMWVNHGKPSPSHHHFYRWFTIPSHGWFMALFYQDAALLWRCWVKHCLVMVAMAIIQDWRWSEFVDGQLDENEMLCSLTPVFVL